MDSKVNYAAVGVFVIGLGAVLVAAILWLAAGGELHKKTDLYQSLSAESVAGLNVNAPVKYRGVDVGKVKDIRLVPDNPQQVAELVYAIDRGTPIKTDYHRHPHHAGPLQRHRLRRALRRQPGGAAAHQARVPGEVPADPDQAALVPPRAWSRC